MKKDIGLLICELDTLTVDFNLILHTFTAVEEGLLNGTNTVDPLAICMPITALRDSIEELRQLKEVLIYATSEKGGADK